MITDNSAASKPSTPGPSASTAPTQPLYQAYPVYTTTPHTVVYVPPVPQRRNRSFCGWLLRAFIVFLAFWIVFKSVLVLIRGSISKDPLPTEPTQWSYDIPTHVDYHGCITGNNWTPWNKGPFDSFPHSATTSFAVPLEHGLYLVERGHLSGGRATYTTSPSQPAGTAKVQIIGWYFRDDLFGLVKACAVQRANGNKENGVGLFTPRWHYWFDNWRRDEDRVKFEIIVTLPEGASKASPGYIKSFITELPNTSQELKDLSSLLFDSVVLTGTNSGITVGALRTHNGTLVTTHGHISGKFDTDSSLSLVTTNGAIDVDVALSANKTDSKLKFNAVTTHGSLRAGVNLLSAAHTGGTFEVTASTTSGRCAVSIPSAPVDSTLRLTAVTTHGRAEAALPPAYEGRFVVATTGSSAVRVDVDERVQDPSGRGRERQVRFASGTGRRGVQTGEVFWGGRAERTREGVVTLSTTNGAAVLSL